MSGIIKGRERDVTSNFYEVLENPVNLLGHNGQFAGQNGGLDSSRTREYGQ